uniref:RING-type domain-containing protein n=1 Tax=Naja naja TaxID=35670 RepID=A0A8C6YE13_NAJNA
MDILNSEFIIGLYLFECRNIMEALVQVLSCPVCLELFTPPVLVLSCAHNFCKKCRMVPSWNQAPFWKWGSFCDLKIAAAPKNGAHF